MITAIDVTWMAYALGLAKRGLFTTRLNPRVGAVLIKNGKIIGEGWHQFPGGPHAEVIALAEAGNEAKGATCYVTLAPCTHYGKTPPCTDALIKAGITRVVAASVDPNPLVAENSAKILTQAQITFETGVLTCAAQALNPGFFMRMQQQRPFVRLKTAMSMDGRTAMQNGESQWITGSAARAHVQVLRAQSCAILTGINTVLADDPSLNVRDIALMNAPHFTQPVRVVLDSQLQTPLDAQLLNLPGRVWIYTLSTDQEKIQRLTAKGATVHLMPSFGQSLDLEAVLAHLAAQQINEVLIEAGSILTGAFLAAHLVDEWHLFVAPKIMGDQARGLCMLQQVHQLSQAINLRIKNQCKIGRDMCYVARPLRNN